ncbi:nitrate/nitrite transporter NrtS [Nodosilinea sp. P-1105]|uniref:nitrate/nitrite transporter NrtS n=1 Tax=Nodosilinea sp. P-1105 TaxID=2546229 RepID=UPI00146F4295|nr:nitrate/nitrite transporter NrtS [Nodosilinea sp. P-1105]NMF86330.1 hypothetical protein [Nodosilinea sp. P-1105]
MKAIKGYGLALVTPQLAAKAAKVALVVGTVLLVINHGRAIRAGTMSRDRWISAALTYLVPYAVSIHGQYMALAAAAPKRR